MLELGLIFECSSELTNRYLVSIKYAIVSSPTYVDRFSYRANVLTYNNRYAIIYGHQIHEALPFITKYFQYIIGNRTKPSAS